MSHLVWFRNDLRTIDQHSLSAACEGAKKVLGVYCFDPRHFASTAYGFPKTGPFRARFMQESVRELRNNLRKLQIPLFLFHGKPEDEIPRLVREYEINTIFYQKEWTQEEVDVESALKKNLHEDAVNFESVYDQFFFHPDDIPYEDVQSIPAVFTEFRKKCEEKIVPRQPISAPSPRTEENVNIPGEQGTIPSLKELGLEDVEMDERSAFPFHGGEDQAWKRIKEYIWESKNVSRYFHTRNGMIGTESSTKFSPWLALGCISPRSIRAEMDRFEEEVEKNKDTYWISFELAVRDYFKYISLKHGNDIFKLGGILHKDDYEWNLDEEKKKQWVEGRTKYSFVNANMIELAKTGWMSNRGRQNVASFWAKEMEQDWRFGASYFESVLIDYDVHSNWGNWMYNAGVGNDPRDRKFNIELQAKKYDKEREYQDLWLSRN